MKKMLKRKSLYRGLTVLSAFLLGVTIYSGEVFEPNKKIITMTIEQKGDFLNVYILNYLIGKRKFKEGRLISTKPNSKNIHGFDTKSMEIIDKKYNGQINYYTFDDVFHLNMYLLK
ncbi:MAG: GHKL domain-containing protein [Bacillales bacterium]|nr:GHKL domain-containing protein [Bacillales bacterium]